MIWIAIDGKGHVDRMAEQSKTLQKPERILPLKM
jgi:hypothetical protein